MCKLRHNSFLFFPKVCMSVMFYVRRRRKRWVENGEFEKLATEQTFKNDMPSEKWFRGFMHRHPELTKRFAVSLPLEKQKLTTNTLQKYFTNWIESSTGANPANILNMDETAIRMEGTKEKVCSTARTWFFWVFVNF